MWWRERTSWKDTESRNCWPGAPVVRVVKTSVPATLTPPSPPPVKASQLKITLWSKGRVVFFIPGGSDTIQQSHKWSKGLDSSRVHLLLNRCHRGHQGQIHFPFMSVRNRPLFPCKNGSLRAASAQVLHPWTVETGWMEKNESDGAGKKGTIWTVRSREVILSMRLNPVTWTVLYSICSI